MEKRYYAAYGSNLNILQMRYRCPSARIIGVAEISDYRLLFKGSKTGAYLTIEKQKGSVVPVGIWEVSAADERSLDRYEGFPNCYYKTEMSIDVKGIRTGKIRRRKCFVYIMHEEREPALPSRSYVRTCIEGYFNFDFNTKYLKQAIQDSRS